MRRVEACPYRADIRGDFAHEVARCRLLEKVVGIAEDERTEVHRDACQACCASPVPSAESLNPVLASLIFPIAIGMLRQKGEPGCDVAKAARLKDLAIENLPKVEPSEAYRPGNEGLCFDLGSQTGLRDCPTCRGSVRVKVYQCLHLLHNETTLADCAKCPDHNARLGRGKVSKWAVGVTTAPRDQPTLDRCLASLEAAGWASPRLFVEPGVEVPERFAHLPITPRGETLGEWPNWFLGLTELYQRDPQADAYMMVQDDTIFSRGVRSFLEAELWPEARVGMVSVYCPEPYARGKTGWNPAPAVAGLIGALTCIFPNAAVRSLLAHPEVVGHRLRGIRRGLVDTDGVIGRWASRSNLPIYHFAPSLAQHIGDTSTVWPGASNSGFRNSDTFVGEDFDATSLIAVEKPAQSAAPIVTIGSPLVSCIMPTANRRGFARLAIDHFLAQDYPNKELIIVDDGDDPIDDLVEGQALVCYVRPTERTTIGEKRNLACRQAQGDLIAHWDDDDWYAPDRLSYQIAPILAGEADLTGLDNRFVLALPGEFWSTRPDLHQKMFVGNVHGGTLVYRRSLLDDGLAYPDLNMSEDAWFLRKALAQGRSLVRLENPGLFVYVRHGKNAWKFQVGRFLDPEGWSRSEAPPCFPESVLDSIRKAAGLVEPTKPEVVVHRDGILADCLGRVEVRLPTLPVRARRCIATVVSPGFSGLLDDMLGSLLTFGQCSDAMIAVFAVDPDPECLRVAAKYGAKLLACTRLASINATVKSVLYSAARVIDADEFLCLDADMLVLGDLGPVFGAIEACPEGSILAIREANGPLYANLGSALGSVYGGRSGDITRIIGRSSGEENDPFVVNDGMFAAGRSAMLALDATIRRWVEAPRWVDEVEEIRWRNQFVFNLALAHLKCGVELDASYNIQLNSESVKFRREGGRIKARWNDRDVRVLHFNGLGREKNSEWRGLFSRVANPLATTGEGDPYAEFLGSLRGWVGQYGLASLAWSFYGTADASRARVRDASTLPLFALLHNLIRSNGCIRVLETGTARGVSAACLASAVAHREGGRVVTFDPFDQPGRLELWASLPDRMSACIESRPVDSIAGMQAALEAGETYQAALLDSVHEADHVWAEFQLAARLVCPGGLILIHDASLAGASVDVGLRRIESAGYGVTRLWTAEQGEPEDDRLGLAVIENRVRERLTDASQVSQQWLESRVAALNSDDSAVPLS